MKQSQSDKNYKKTEMKFGTNACLLFAATFGMIFVPSFAVFPFDILPTLFPIPTTTPTPPSKFYITQYRIEDNNVKFCNKKSHINHYFTNK